MFKNQREISMERFKASKLANTPNNWHIWKRAFDLGVSATEKNSNGFNRYLIMVGIRSAEFTLSDDVINENLEYFKDSYNSNLSAYKALLFLTCKDN